MTNPVDAAFPATGPGNRGAVAALLKYRYDFVVQSVAELRGDDFSGHLYVSVAASGLRYKFSATEDGADDGENLLVDLAGNRFVLQTVTPGLGDLVDVTITTPAVGDILRYDGENWVNDTPSGWSSLAVVAGEATPDLSNGGLFLLTVDADCELQFPANPVAGAPFVIRVVMSGAHAFTFAAEWLGSLPSVLVADGDETVLSGIVLDTSPASAVINIVKSIAA